MNMTISDNTKAILLLTAPLIAGRGESSPELLTQGEYNRLVRVLLEHHAQPADLLVPGTNELLTTSGKVIDGARLTRLLERGFLLSQAIERWHTRGIWVISRADSDYPRRLKERLKENAPPILYGCGELTILNTGGLAVVGSRNVDDALIEYTEHIGRLAAKARRTLVSGGARGIDQAAMRGALEVGGKVVGVLADSLDRAAVARENRQALMNEEFVLISPYDPSAPFNVGHAMQRNKSIYALADAALIVNSDYQKGGTWAGAIEQLDKFKTVPIYVRSSGGICKGLSALVQKGALPWPNPETPEALEVAVTIPTPFDLGSPKQITLPLGSPIVQDKCKVEIHPEQPTSEITAHEKTANYVLTPAEELFAKVRELLERMDEPKTDVEIAEGLQVSKSQAREWLQRLVEEGVLQTLPKPTRYYPL